MFLQETSSLLVGHRGKRQQQAFFQTGAVGCDPLIHFLRAVPARHTTVHYDHVESAITEPLLRVLHAHRRSDFSSRAHQHVAFKFQHRFLVFDQEHAPCQDRLSPRGRHRLRQRGFLACQQTDFNRRSSCRSGLLPVARHDFSAMFLDDPVADAQPQAGALAHRLGGIEGIENSAGVLDSRTAVIELHAHVSVFLEATHFQHPAAARLHHGIEGVVGNVQEDLLELMRIGHHRGQVVGNVAFQRDIVDLQIVFAQREGLLQHLAQVHFLLLRLALARKREQILHHPVRPLRLLEQFAHIVGRTVVEARAFEQLRVTEDCG